MTLTLSPALTAGRTWAGTEASLWAGWSAIPATKNPSVSRNPHNLEITVADAKEVAAQATMTCSQMPNQFEGIVDGRAFYFRARHGEWSLRIAPPGFGQDDIFDHGEVVAFGEDDNAGWWEEPEARAALARAIEQYRSLPQEDGR